MRQHLAIGIELQHRQVLRPDVLVTRCLHLVLGRQIHPELEAAHFTFHLLGHLRMHDAAPSRHPLHATGHQQALAAVVVAMAHTAFQHVGDGLEAAVRMHRKTGDVVLRTLGAEGVEHQKRIDRRLLRCTDEARQFDAGTIGSGQASRNVEDVAGHRIHATMLGVGAPSLKARIGTRHCAAATPLRNTHRVSESPAVLAHERPIPLANIRHIDFHVLA